MADESKEKETDEDGLIVQKYLSKVLVVLPSEGIGDQMLRYARSCLYNVHVGTTSVASSEIVRGRLQDEFMVDSSLDAASMEEYSGILVAGCEGVHPLADDAHVHALLKSAADADKLIATWGNGLAVLARAGVLKGHRVTGSKSCESDARSAGAKYSGRQVESSKNVITGLDESAGMRFGQALAEKVHI